jgi:hypothetical protein
MAHITEFTCRHCKQEVHEIVTGSYTCVACRTAIAEANEAAYMAKLAAIPLAERVRRLELELYRLDADARLKAIEAANARY